MLYKKTLFEFDLSTNFRIQDPHGFDNFSVHRPIFKAELQSSTLTSFRTPAFWKPRKRADQPISCCKGIGKKPGLAVQISGGKKVRQSKSSQQISE